MKQLIRIIFILFVLFVGLFTQAYTQTSAPMSGRVVGYLANRTGDYDGVRLQTLSNEVRLYFPPHTAASVLRLANVGQRISVEVEPKLDPIHVHRRDEEGGERETARYHLIRLRNEASGMTVQLSNLHPPPPKPGTLVQAEGSLVSDMYDEQGQLSALVIDKYLIVIPPHQAKQISSLMIGVQRLGVTGFERTQEGFVNRSGRAVIRPTSLTIRSQTFTF